MLALFFLVGLVHSQACESGWTEYNNNCYKHFDTPNQRLTIPGVRSKCQSLGGDIAVGATIGERQFMENMNRPSYNGKFIFFDPYSDQLLVGITQDIFNTFVSAVPGDPIVDRPLPWCGKAVQQAEPNQWGAKERCVMHHSFESNAFCYHDIMCKGGDGPGFRRYMCKKSKGARG